MYQYFLKRAIDFSLSIIALILVSWILIILTIIGFFAMKGNPFFMQKRPGKKDKNGNERLFRLIKYRTMSYAKDSNGFLLPDNMRLNKYGRFLRCSSLDELPELFNILVGDMSFVGPRPQLVKDMVFMSEEQKERHRVKPGLSGLAQINGRNNISWFQKIDYDLEYISNISFKRDIAIIIKTIYKVFKKEDVVRNGTSSDIDFGDFLLANGFISNDVYKAKQEEAFLLLGKK